MMWTFSCTPTRTFRAMKDAVASYFSIQAA
jgi:hypothetical protein